MHSNLPFRLLHLACTVALCLVLLAACQYSPGTSPDAWVPEQDGQVDSVEFRATHHYWCGYNFLLTAPDTLLGHAPFYSDLDLRAQRPPVPLEEDDLVLVASVRSDSTGQIWLELITDRGRAGWITEQQFLPHASPRESVARQITWFSQLWVKIVILSLGAAALLGYLFCVRRAGMRPRLGSILYGFYPTVLTLLTAAAALLYNCLLHFYPATWGEYYYHPTINPFSPGLPAALALLIGMSWACLVWALATAEDIRTRQQGLGKLSLLLAVTGTNILCFAFFALCPPAYVGLPLFCLLTLWLGWRFCRPSRR